MGFQHTSHARGQLARPPFLESIPFSICHSTSTDIDTLYLHICLVFLPLKCTTEADLRSYRLAPLPPLPMLQTINLHSRSSTLTLPHR